MNAANPAIFPYRVAPPVPPVPPVSSAKPVEPPFDLPRLLLGLALAVFTFDFCFWGIQSLGLSLAVFALLLAGIILANRQLPHRNRTTTIILGLIVGATVATAFETDFANTLVLIVLVVALAGHTYFTGADSVWGRWLSQCIALLFAPGRVFWLAARVMEAGFKGGVGSIGKLIGGILLAVPALVLAVVFGSLLAAGNPVFDSWTSSFFNWIWNELALYLNALRILLWMVAAFVILPLLRPAAISDWWWRWTERLPRLPEIVPNRGAIFSSGLVLVVLNLMFFIANFADACFLWSGKSVPAGVTYSGYVHSGTNALTATVILSAFVLTFIFQQSLKVASSRSLKVLAYVWIAQNLFLLMSVALRLQLYIQAYDMTVLRLGVIIFLVVVATGFVLLTIKIARDRSLSWLIGGCILAMFATLYVTQFLDLEGWSANYNVARWEKDRTRNLDVAYLHELGPAAWPALDRAHRDDGSIQIIWEATRENTPAGSYTSKAVFDSWNWREFSLRAYLNRWALDDNE